MYIDGLSPSELATYSGPTMLYISFLGLISRHLPNLQKLMLSVFACDTSTLEPNHLISPLKHLELMGLYAKRPFNWKKRQSFNEHGATLYIGSMLTPKVELYSHEFHVSCDAAEWKQFEKERRGNSWLNLWTRSLITLKSKIEILQVVSLQIV